ncbi:MAG: hypothetical protein NVSMB39_2310 [Candidatus Saccharimonadales bacterium]
MDKGLVSMIMGWIVDWFSSQWMTSGAAAVDSAMKQMTRSPWPALDAAWFKVLWNNFFGLCMLVVVFLAIPRVIAFALDMRSGDRLSQVCIDVLKMFLIGLALLVGLAYGMQLIDLADKMILAATTGGSNNPEWYKPLMSINGIQSLWGGLLLALIGMVSGMVLWFETLLIQQAMFVFAVLYMAAFSIKRWRIGHWMFQWAWAGLRVTLLAKPLMLLWMGLWSIALMNINDKILAAVLSMVAVFFAAWLPVAAFLGLLIHSVKVEGRIEAERKSRPNEDSFEGSFSAGELNRRYSSSMMQNASKTGAKVRGAAGATGAALATLALQRGGDWMSKKALIAGQPGVAAALKGGSKAASWMGNRLIMNRPMAQKLTNHGNRGLAAVAKYRSNRPGSRGSQPDFSDE